MQPLLLLRLPPPLPLPLLLLQLPPTLLLLQQLPQLLRLPQLPPLPLLPPPRPQPLLLPPPLLLLLLRSANAPTYPMLPLLQSHLAQTRNTKIRPAGGNGLATPCWTVVASQTQAVVAPVLVARVMLHTAGTAAADGAGGGELPMSATRWLNSTARLAWRRVCCNPVIFSAVAMPH